MSLGNGYAFAKLLSEGVYMISVREGKNLGTVQDELGYALGRDGGSPIIYWRRGHIPTEWSEVEMLAQEILNRTGFGQDWLKKFYAAAGIPGYEARAEKLLELSTPGAQPLHASGSLPLNPSRMIGRQSLADELLTVLASHETLPMVAVDGMGGIGKTELVSWVAHQAVAENLFEDLIWLTAATPMHSVSSSVNAGSLTTDAMLNDIGNHLQVPGVARLNRNDKALRIKSILSARRILIVLDNLETAGDPQSEIVEELRALLGISKAIVVSRYRFMGEYCTEHLSGLSEEDGLEFLYRQAEYRRVNRVASADHEDLQSITQTAGGSPLAMKLILGHLFHLPLPTVLDHLKNVRPIDSRKDNDEYVTLYRHIFFPSWELVEHQARRLLVSMAHFAPGVGDEMDIVQEISGIDDKDVVKAVEQLWLASLLEVDESSTLPRVRYYLHALTQNFVLSDIINRP